MMRATITSLIGCALAIVAGCGGGGAGHDAGSGGGMDMGTMPGVDTGPGGHDAFVVPMQDGGSCTSSGDCPGSYCNTGTHTCCVPAVPPVERCGDHIDQNCDGHDESCGDNDGDTFNACTATDPDLTMCDCDDTDRNTYPARGTLPGGVEACDMRDNDCDGRIDEAAACCPACMALGDTTRGDVCGADGSCQCSTAPGGAVCAAGQACCSSGCVDTSTDLNNCGSCGIQCTNQTDRCVGGRCYCGPPPGVACMATTMCHSGTCG